MDLEERVRALEVIFNQTGRLKSEADIRMKIRELEKEEQEISEQINKETNKSKVKELYIKRYRVQDFIKDLRWCFDDGD